MKKSTYRDTELVKDRKKIMEIEKAFPSFAKKFLTYLSTHKKSPKTVLAYAYDLKIFFYFITSNNSEIESPEKITLEHVKRFKPSDIEDYLEFLTSYELDGKTYVNSDSGKNRKLATIKSLWKWLVSFEYVTYNPTTAINALPLKKGEIKKLEPGEVREVMEELDNLTFLKDKQKKFAETLQIKTRDKAIIMLFLGTGIRISELVGLNMEDVSFKVNSAVVTRKGNNEEKVFFNEEVAEILKKYIYEDRKEPLDGSTALFVSARGTRLGVRAVEKLVKRHVEHINANISPHKLRSTYATMLYRNTHDLLLIQDALGHKTPSMARKYADIGNARRKEASEYIKFDE